MALSEEEKRHALSELKEYTEQGLLCPEVKPSLLGIPPEDFVSNGLKFGGNPLPEFASISRNVLDCFAVAVLAIPFVEIPPVRIVFTCRLHENRGKLMLYLVASLESGGAMLPLELSTDGEVCLASYIRRLSATKSMSLGSIYWDRVRRYSFFFLEYPGKLVRAKVPGLGDPGEDGEPRWPELKLAIAQVTTALRAKARDVIAFVKVNDIGPVH
ncbi:MAG: hypothetical protein ACRD3B_18025 [Candidatus Sulfotelmatobacter sp.]